VLRGLVLAAVLSSAVHARPVPILMYHLVAPAPAGAAYPQLYVRPRDFDAEMSWLARSGYTAVTLQRVYDHWTRGVPLPSRPVVISFDDGYLSQYVSAFPTLRSHDWPGVLNLQTSFLRTRFGMVPWRVRRLIGAGWEIDAHSVTHPNLTTVDDAQLWNEVSGARTTLQWEFGIPVDFFCYPSGKYDARVIDAVRRAGFSGATTTTTGLAQPPDYFTLPRIRVDGTDGVRGLALKLAALG
jgi:peptidoglycan/xylan/chitin deacetylase (PgdA/CDA1 family)